MPGMGHGIDIHNPTIVNLFRQGLQTNFKWLLGLSIVFAIFFSIQSLRRVAQGEWSEPRGRTVLRLGLGLLWLLDGLLQLQAAMPLGLGTQVIEPSKEAAPSWWHGVIGGAVQFWNEHPLVLAQSVVWVQVGLAVLLLFSSQRLSRFAGLLSSGWALVIWLAAGFGGMMGHTPSLLFGWPGAPILYVIAGLALSLDPEKFPHVYQAVVSRVLGLIFIVGAILQVLPNNGFWVNGSDNALNQMALDMSGVPQPGILSGAVHIFAGVVRAAGPGINILAVVWMMAVGVGVWRSTVSGFAWPSRSLVIGSILAWVLVQDTGLFGGLATDPNSMLLFALIGYTLSPSMRTAAPMSFPLSTMARRAIANAGLAIGVSALTVGAYLGVTACFANVETTMYEAYNGSVSEVSAPAPDFGLTDQQNRQFVLSQLRGKTVLLSFLDPVCYEECPQIGHQLLDTVKHYQGLKKPVAMVVVTANLKDHSNQDVAHFMSEYDMVGVRDLYFLNGSTHQLAAVFEQYGVTVASGGEHGMSIHTNVIYVIDSTGQLRYIVSDDPAPGAAGRASTVRVLERAVDALQ